ncbi:MAG: sugar ABC transporter ATP-binding protein [Ruminiclostridium sp.]
MGYDAEFKNVSKTYVTVKALQNISFKADGGQVCALLGENGAGKSTLLKILSGDQQPDSGCCAIDGKDVYFKSPHEAIQNGISVIYQERQLIPYLSVAENIFMEDIPVKKSRLINFSTLNKMAEVIIDKFNLPIQPTDKVEDISVAHQQMVEIMKAYRRNSRIIAFDEPTASLSDAEIETLFKVIGQLKSQGKVIFYVSHRLKELFQISDIVVILKDGEFVTQIKTAEINEKELIKYMIGRDLGDIFNALSRNAKIEDVVLEVKNLKNSKVNDINFKLHKGQILGFAGLVGAGRTETMRTIFGADQLVSGEICIEGQRCHIKNPSKAISLGLGFCPEDRKEQGIIGFRSVKENISIAILKRLSKMNFIDFKEEEDIAWKQIKALNIKTPNTSKKTVELSGGNQQKVILARWLSANPKVLILDEPTKGVDVGAKAEIYQMICDLAKKGIGIILISSELTEIIGLSDQIIVMREGEISGVLNREEADEEKILTLAMIQ